MSDTTERPEFDLEVDATGLKCPLPILRAKKALTQLQSGQVLKVITTDPHAVRDFQAFSKQTGNGLLAQIHGEGTVTHFMSRR
ncbi:sulfurtransferase TusA family protein [Pusillimonas caeni]|uniref:sulfurtransferase TusA family protein n=1 Tax=Pusillimonas caeni TaxID=1348472 RepID=UPI000E59C80E|nr:sulfurtransferase TusA family protein [Pusillimonas caeni]TFL10217.1 sulfurtransferase TusA family protein [Pusillimonas caeni]